MQSSLPEFNFSPILAHSRTLSEDILGPRRWGKTLSRVIIPLRKLWAQNADEEGR